MRAPRASSSTRRSYPLLAAAAAAGITSLSLTACGTASSPGDTNSSGGSTKLTLGYSEVTGDNIPLFVGEHAGIFTKNKITVDLRSIPSTTALSATLSGDTDIAAVGGSEMLSAAASGADVVALANLAPVYTYQLYVSKNTTTASQLKGKRIGVSSLGGSSAVGTKIALSKLGLDSQKDVSLIAMGSHPARTAALISGSIAAEPDEPPSTSKLDKLGFHPLISLPDYKIPNANTVLVAKRSWVNSHKDLVQKFITSVVKSIAVEKSSESTSVAAMDPYFKGATTASLQKAWEYYSQHVVQSRPTTSPEDFTQVIKYANGHDKNEMQTVNLSSVIDNSFVDAAMKATG